MDYITIKNIRKSFKSHLEALKEMYALFPDQIYELDCSSFNSHIFEGFNINCPIEDFIPIATDFYVRNEDLFDFSRPKIIQEGYRCYDSSFFTVKLSWQKSYYFYRTNYATQELNDETGKYKRIPPKETEYDKLLRLSWDGNFGIGLKDWNNRYQFILNLLNENPDKEMIKKYQDLVNKANEEFIKWKEEIKKLSLIKV